MKDYLQYKEKKWYVYMFVSYTGNHSFVEWKKVTELSMSYKHQKLYIMSFTYTVDPHLATCIWHQQDQTMFISFYSQN